ncbi:MAG TPA: GyrI-like domain-containing protein [Saprospiraceae bacterium]|nr:GyrI-like domain-containing protein [Saprospiraceae bacterium]
MEDIFPLPHRIERLQEKKLIGMKMSMTFADNKTAQLWKSFMPRRGEIQDAIGTDLYSLQKYPPSFFNPFNPMTTFEKWAAMEVIDFNLIPDGMEALVIPGGEYAVFIYRGDARNASPFFQYIFSKWLPASGYPLDARPHFEILGEKYKHNDGDSEEEVWIPILV